MTAKKTPKFSMGFDIVHHTYQEMKEAFNFYQRAFGATKITEFLPYDSDDNNLHIIMEIHGIEVLLHPGGEERIRDGGIWAYDDDEALKNAIDVLSQDAQQIRMESWPHWPIAAFIVDKYGVSWSLHN